MATVFNLEPQPTAKVILHTTSGDLSLELFAQQTPITSRNFLQLCLDGYYDNTIFHRLVPNFIIQGGDPTGTGAGGESSHESGKPFADEFHSRLKFNRRGLLGMANSGSRDDNGSQFFLTLGKAEELNGRNTMFGRVEAGGNTIFNLVKMGEVDLAEGEGSERPMYPTRVTGAEVLVNPFADMVKRATVAATASRSKDEGAGKKKQPLKKKAGKQLLSFGGAEDGEEPVVVPVKTAKFNPQLVNTVLEKEPVTTTINNNKRAAPQPSKTTQPPIKRRQTSRSPSASPLPPLSMPAQPAQPSAPRSRSPPASSSPPPQAQAQPQSKPPTKLKPTPTPMELATLQIAALKASLKRDVPAPVPTREPRRSALEAMIPTTAMRGRKRKAGGAGTGAAGGGGTKDEQSVLEEFRAFQRKLEATATAKVVLDDDASPPLREQEGEGEDEEEEEVAAETTKPFPNTHASVKRAPNSGPLQPAATDDDADEEEAHLCDLHFIANCQSCRKWEGQDSISSLSQPNNYAAEAEHEDHDGEAWMSHQLSFAKDRLGKDLEWKRQNEKELVVIDPREKEREINGAKRAGREREREREMKREMGKAGGGRGAMREWDRAR